MSASTTFVDVTTIEIDFQDPATRQNQVMTAMDYMDSNRLPINPERKKEKIFVINQDPIIRKELHLDIQPERIIHSPTILYLGIALVQDLKWNKFIIDNKFSLPKMLTKRVNAICKLYH